MIETALEVITEADKNKYIIACTSKGKGEIKNAQGIVGCHAYTLTGVFKLSNGQNLIKLRNPWGSGEWIGDWSDSSKKWTDALKKEVGLKVANDGIFYMSFQDFVEQYENVNICHYNSQSIYSSMRSKNNCNQTQIIQFSVGQSGEYYIGLS